MEKVKYFQWKLEMLFFILHAFTLLCQTGEGLCVKSNTKIDLKYKRSMGGFYKLKDTLTN